MTDFVNLYNENDKFIKKATEGSSGYDLHAKESVVIEPGSFVIVKTGVFIEMQKNMEAHVRSRSGLATKGIFVLNGIGTIDSDYRGEIGVILANFSKVCYNINKDDRIAQLVFCKLPNIVICVVDKLSSTQRGLDGFGSTGRSTTHELKTRGLAGKPASSVD